MAKKIYISPSNQYANTYATGNTNEREQCHKIAKACVDYLQKYGFEVKCTYNDDMYVRVKESNDFKADMHVAIHTNATGAHNITGGTQILLYSLDGERMKAGLAVFNELSPLTPGKSAERLVAKPGFYECNSVNGLTVYCECEFHDTEEGSNFIINNTTQIGEAIAKGICNYYEVNTTPVIPVEPIPTPAPVINKDIEEWQKAAVADGYQFPKYGIDNKWGKECEAVAELAICKKAKIWGRYTNKNLTKFVQKKVGLTGKNIDGKFWEGTEGAVKAYQAANGLEVDGVVGIKTWKKMLGVK